MDQLHTDEIHKYLTASAEIALEAGAVLTSYWGKLEHVVNKTYVGDLVTEADKESEKVILKLLKEKFPRHAVLAEESGWHVVEDAEFVWFVDPLDGTTNFAHQYPMFAVSIGLFFQGKPLTGVVFNPVHNELYQAGSNLGAKLNGKPISVSRNQELSNSLLATGFPYDRRENPNNNYAEFCRLTHITHGVRRAGSAALDLAYVASGRVDGYWELGLKPWDIAAGIVLVKEAGGVVSSYDNGPVDYESGKLLATNGWIHRALSHELLQSKKPILLDDKHLIG